MFHIPAVLDQAALAEITALLKEADWQDGRTTAGEMSIRVKNNRQLAEGAPAALAAGAVILKALETNPLFMSAALPAHIVPPLFNRYERGEHYGPHIDGAIRHFRGQRVRTDLSATLFLSAPESYEGGELVIRESGGIHQVKLPLGDMLLYSGTSIHHVEPVTRGSTAASGSIGPSASHASRGAEKSPIPLRSRRRCCLQWSSSRDSGLPASPRGRSTSSTRMVPSTSASVTRVGRANG